MEPTLSRQQLLEVESALGYSGWRTRLYGSEDVRVFILPHALLIYSPDGRNPRRRRG